MIVPVMMRVTLMTVVVMRVIVDERRTADYRVQAADEKAEADAQNNRAGNETENRVETFGDDVL